MTEKSFYKKKEREKEKSVNKEQPFFQMSLKEAVTVHQIFTCIFKCYGKNEIDVKL